MNTNVEIVFVFVVAAHFDEAVEFVRLDRAHNKIFAFALPRLSSFGDVGATTVVSSPGRYAGSDRRKRIEG